MKVQNQLRVSACRSGEGFIRRYQELVKEVVIPYQYEVLSDRAQGAEKSHVIANFINAGAALAGKDPGDGFYGMVFQDSDAAKWLEAVAGSLELFPDEKLEEEADHLIDLIRAAQDQDGYLNTYYTVKDREKRWQNLMEGHELYCSGHMMEAAVAYYEATGKRTLLDVMVRNAEHIYRHFITEGNEGYPGHPEVELALLKLYRCTKDRRWLELAAHFIDERGKDPRYFARETEKRGWTLWGGDGKDVYYAQNYAPVREQSDAVGHSVRAVYLYTAMADLASETGDEELLRACRRLWKSITEKRMYITGGIGSTVIGEAFTVDYDLPNDTVYAETCASIGLIYFASRMLENEVNGEYGDVMECALYNTVLAGMQLDGKRFFYVNPLEVIPGISGRAATHRHVLPQRPAWYACACCPPNVARTLSSIARYAYGTSAYPSSTSHTPGSSPEGCACGTSEPMGYCHLYVSGEVDFGGGFLVGCETEYPRDLTVTYHVRKGRGGLALRIPGWSRTCRILKNGGEYAPEIVKGYGYFPGLTQGDTIELRLDDQPYFVYASSRVPADSGRAALKRGPLVYCFEGVDNGGDVLSLSLNTEKEAVPEEPLDSLPPDVIPLRVQGFRQEKTDTLYTAERPGQTPCELRAVPYYVWGNRGENQMRVWLPYR